MSSSPAETFRDALWRLTNFKEANSALPAGSQTSSCMLVDVNSCKSSCAQHPGHGCGCPRKVFQSRRNSKRNLHLYRFLRALLGHEFPIPDSMCGVVKRYLECDCSNGLRRSNLHQINRASHEVCVNEQHYRLTRDPEELENFFQDFKESMRVFLPHESHRFVGLEELIQSSLDFDSFVSELTLRYRISTMATAAEMGLQPIHRPRNVACPSAAVPSTPRAIRHRRDTTASRRRALLRTAAAPDTVPVRVTLPRGPAAAPAPPTPTMAQQQVAPDLFRDMPIAPYPVRAASPVPSNASSDLEQDRFLDWVEEQQRMEEEAVMNLNMNLNLPPHLNEFGGVEAIHADALPPQLDAILDDFELNNLDHALAADLMGYAPLAAAMFFGAAVGQDILYA